MSDFPPALPSRDYSTRSGLRELVKKARRDASYLQSALTDISAALDALGVSDEIPRRNINGPVTATGCPECGVAQGHAADCPTLEAEEPA